MALEGGEWAGLRRRACVRESEASVGGQGAAERAQGEGCVKRAYEPARLP